MRVAEFLDALKAKDILIWVENGKVKYEINSEDFSDDFLQKLKSHKQEIIDYLSKSEKRGETNNQPQDVRTVLNDFVGKGCFFQFADDGSTVEYPAYLLTEAENNWLTANHWEAMAILFQSWLMRNVFNQNPDQLEQFKFEVNERIALMTDSDYQAVYLDAVLQIGWQWWLNFQPNFKTDH